MRIIHDTLENSYFDTSIDRAPIESNLINSDRCRFLYTREIKEMAIFLSNGKKM